MKGILFLLIFISSVLHAHESSSKLKMVQLSDNVYQHISYKEIPSWGMVAASGLLVVDGNDAYMIDTPWTLKETKQLITWAENKGLTVKSSIVTHFHEDASGGISFLNDLKIQTYATKLTNQLLTGKGRDNSSHEITSEIYELLGRVDLS